MKVIDGEVTIARPVADVFEFVATPGNWPRWYPITRMVEAVTGRADAPARAGTVVREHVSVLGAPMTFEWRFEEVTPPSLVRYQGSDVKWGGHAAIEYRFTPTSDGRGTVFHRHLEYQPNNWIIEVADVLGMHREFEKVSAQALETVKRVLEG